MAELETNRPGITVIVDDDIAEMLKDCKITVRTSTPGAWYAWARTDAGTKPVARLVIDVPEGIQVDHINRNPLDNRRENLRPATRTQNARNRWGWGQTGYKGVRARGPRGAGPYEAAIYVDKKRIYLGRLKTAEEAARLYDAAAKERFGEFAALNFDD
ncbi:HNH endonuclease [Nonomuraea sp. NEAU-A123]|uniref:HNH endonuclease n=1 Tax=Nonomuraea sp. NEAU-A123 TaxID=2839649 RepID=UPI001BE47652|nr:HNH endonuclease [Nonomuraea sp. NEAU-A123]MBT2232198.1 HNH endonuclease [Nonomuraea sp. NEAU-A123]